MLLFSDSLVTSSPSSVVSCNLAEIVNAAGMSLLAVTPTWIVYEPSEALYIALVVLFNKGTET